MQQPVALLDVDHTLLFGYHDSFNEALATSLLDHGITRVYLFTDMTLHEHAIQDRNKLVKLMEQMGFAVQGVITPNDVTWSSVPPEEMHELSVMCFAGREYSGKLYSSEFEDFVLSRSNVLPVIGKAMTTYQPMKCVLGEGFNDAAMEYFRSGFVGEATKTRSVFAKVFADHLSDKLGYKHNKGLLLDIFLRHRPAWVSSIVVCDDHPDVIDDVENFRPVPASAVSVSAPGTPTANSTCGVAAGTEDSAGTGERGGSVTPLGEGAEWLVVPPITMIPVTSAKLPAKYYNDLLDAHMRKVT